MPTIDVLIVERDPSTKKELCNLVAKAGLSGESTDRMPDFISDENISHPHCVIASSDHFKNHTKTKSENSELLPVFIGIGDKGAFSMANALDLTLSKETPNECLINAAKCLVTNRKNEIRIRSQIRSFNERFSKVSRLETLGMLASEFSHDVKNFSFVAEYNSARLEQTLKENYWDDKIAKRMTTIRSNIDRISTLAKQILDYSQANEDVEWESLDIHAVLEDVSGYFGYASSQKSPVLLQSFAPQAFKVKALRLDLLRLFMNLLNNAREAVEKTPNAWVKIETSRLDNQVRIRILDSGEGIPQVFQDRIMAPFFTTKKESKGTGIGLSIAKEIVEKYR